MSLAEYKKQVSNAQWESRPWFITMTLKPEHYSLKLQKQYLLSLPYVKSILDSMCTKYILAPEITKAGNIHYHAVATFKEENSRMMAILLTDIVKTNKFIGNTKVNDKQVEDKDLERTYDYISKEITQTEGLINFNGFNKPRSEYDIIHTESKQTKKKTPSKLTKLLDCMNDCDEFGDII